jgi:hypothetical protein
MIINQAYVTNISDGRSDRGPGRPTCRPGTKRWHGKVWPRLAFVAFAAIAAAGPARAETKTPFQTPLTNVSCSFGTCKYLGPVVPTNHRLDVQHVSCMAEAFASGARNSIWNAEAQLWTASGTNPVTTLQVLVGSVQTTTRIDLSRFVMSQPILLYIPANHRLAISVRNDIKAPNGSCFLAGQMVQL